MTLTTGLPTDIMPGDTGHIAHHNVLHGEKFNVRAYGAVGDGITDDRVPIQAAIDAAVTPDSVEATAEGELVNRGGDVCFSPGKYNVSSPGLVLAIPQWGVNLVGASGAPAYWYGRDVTQINYTGASGTLLTMTSGHNNRVEKIGFTVSHASYSGDMVRLIGGGGDDHSIVFEHCGFTNEGGSTGARIGLRFDVTIISKVHKCRFQNFDYNFAFSFSNYTVANTVDDCTFNGAKIAHIYVGAGYAEMLRVTNCVFEPGADNGARGVLMNPAAGFIRGFWFTGNWCGDTGESTGFGWIKGAFRGAFIAGNAFNWSGTGVPAIDITGDTIGIAVLGNDFYDDTPFHVSGGTCQGLLAGGNSAFHTSTSGGGALSKPTILQGDKSILSSPAIRGVIATYAAGDRILIGETNVAPSGIDAAAIWWDSGNFGYLNIQPASDSAGHSVGRLLAGTTPTVKFAWGADGLGFYGTGPGAKPTITGAKGGNAALASLISGLAARGLVTDSTT